MDPLYLMQALGLDTPILEAIHGTLFSTYLFRSIFSFFLELGFSFIESKTIHPIAHTEYSFEQAGNRKISCFILISHDGKHLIASAIDGYEIYNVQNKLEYKNDGIEITFSRAGYNLEDKGFPNETMLEIWKERVINLTQKTNQLNEMNNNIFGL